MAGVSFALGVAVGANGWSPSAQRAEADVAMQPEPRALGGERAVPGMAGPMGTPQAARLSNDQGVRSPRAKTNASLATDDVAKAQQTLVVEQAVALPVTPLWQLAAQQGEYQSALIELEANGGFEAVAAKADADQLMLLADVARATGFRQRAVLAWRRVISQHATDPQAPLAAWSLGNVLEKSGDAVGAAEAFAAYRNLSPQGDFAEDALAREIRMAVAQQNTQLANRLAAQYDQAFPNGRRAMEVREQLAKLQHQPTSVGTVDAGVPEEEATASPK
jgi:TolA-binding protein